MRHAGGCSHFWPGELPEHERQHQQAREHDRRLPAGRSGLRLPGVARNFWLGMLAVHGEPGRSNVVRIHVRNIGHGNHAEQRRCLLVEM
jgi:hypothetical protein